MHEADSCVIKNSHKEMIILIGDTLNKYKTVLTRAVQPEGQKPIRNDFSIELYNRNHKIGDLSIQLDHLIPFANFNSGKLKFGFRVSYGLGMSLDELQLIHKNSN